MLGISHIKNLRSCRLQHLIVPCAQMRQSKLDQEAIATYNKLLRKPLQDTSYTASELREAKKYFTKIKEYRTKSEEGFEPSKLFMVWKVAEPIHRPHWEKDLLIELGLHERKISYAIVKNTPSMNKKLWTIKHLIRLRPITFPEGFPEEEDVGSSFLKQTGELVISKRLQVDPKELGDDSPEYKHKKLGYRTISENLRLKWDVGYPALYEK